MFLFSLFPLARWIYEKYKSGRSNNCCDIKFQVLILSFTGRSERTQYWFWQWEDGVEPFKLQLYLHTQWFNHNTTRKVMKPDIKCNIKQSVKW